MMFSSFHLFVGGMIGKEESTEIQYFCLLLSVYLDLWMDWDAVFPSLLTVRALHSVLGNWVAFLGGSKPLVGYGQPTIWTQWKHLVLVLP